MDANLPSQWIDSLSQLDFAFQPIALFAGGGTYGFEALLRGWDRAGFPSIASVFDRAFKEGCLHTIDFALRKKAFEKFARADLGSAKIFFNVDNRLLQMADYATGDTLRIAEDAGLKPSRIVFELSELHEPDDEIGFDRVLAAYRSHGFRIALDDFGSGYAGLKFLHRAEPDIVKIDRYFVSGAAEEPRKAAFLEKIVGMAHLMGITVVAEGVETAQELALCAEAGCDLVQGYFVALPSLESASLSLVYPTAVSPGGDRRSPSAGRVEPENLLRCRPMRVDAPLGAVLSRFRKEPEASIIPVVNGLDEPVGVYRERDFRHYVFSPYGISLLEHITAQIGPSAFLVKAPTAPVGTELSRIVELFGASVEGGAVVFTDNGRFIGLLPAKELLSLVAERKLAEARDQNPLTRLPGNLRVAEVCAQRLADHIECAIFAYYDFDNFKPFNDRYGFRNGDRVIMLFADILRSSIAGPGSFVGHLGGDDFFACLEGSAEDGLAPIIEAAERFAPEAASFYPPEDRERGWILGRDRSGRERRMPLLGVSTAIVVLKPGARLEAEGLSEILARLKKKAKAAPDHRAVAVIEPEDPPKASVGSGGSRRGERLRDSGEEPDAVFHIFTPALITAT